MAPDNYLRLFETFITALVAGGGVWGAIRVDIAHIHKRIEFLERVAWEDRKKD